MRTPLLFLDEPTVGLDPVTARDLRRVVTDDLVRRYGQTVIITSHFAPESVRRVASRRSRTSSSRGPSAPVA